jgi:hypothetical protein
VSNRHFDSVDFVSGLFTIVLSISGVGPEIDSGREVVAFFPDKRQAAKAHELIGGFWMRTKKARTTS